MEISEHHLELLVSSSSVILAHLRRGGFHRLDLQTQVAETPQLLIEQLKRQTPDVVILEFRPKGDTNAFALCQTIRTDLGLTELPVIIVSRSSLPQALLPMIASSGCSEVLTTPLSRGQLHDVVCELVGLPYRRQRRYAARAKISVKGEVSYINGLIRDVTLKGARMQLDEVLERASGQTLCCCFDVEHGPPFDATVAWTRRRGAGTELAVQFDALPEAAALHLRNLITWRMERRDGEQRVILQEQFTEVSDFSELIPLLTSPVVFDLFQLRYFNSVGVSRWVNLLRQIPADVEFSFARCSVTFCVQAGFIPLILGRGRITSFLAPFECLECRLEEEHEMEVSTGDDGVGLPPLPAVPCPSCRSEMTFSDLPEQYFSFLQLRR
jgi:CheY-like chemotaxis protein